MSGGVNFQSSRDSNSKIGEALTYRLQESLLQRVNMPSSDMPRRAVSTPSNCSTNGCSSMIQSMAQHISQT